MTEQGFVGRSERDRLVALDGKDSDELAERYGWYGDPALGSSNTWGRDGVPRFDESAVFVRGAHDLGVLGHLHDVADPDRRAPRRGGTDDAVAHGDLRADAFDVHKGIRAELLAVTEEAGCADAGQPADRAALASHVDDVVTMLTAHAEHEETIQSALEHHLPALAAQVESDHEALDARPRGLQELAGAAADTPGSARPAVHHLYLELASFAGAYLAHQDLEEREVMPALHAAIGVDAVLGIHEAIIAAIPPDRFLRFMAAMLPAMNVDDRTELLGGLRATVPTELFDRTWSVARSVLGEADQMAVAARLELR